MSAGHTRRFVATAAALAALVVSWSACAVYRRDIRVARARIAERSVVAQTRCGAIEYAIAGDGAPLLLVHGAGGGYDQGLDIGAPLARRGVRVIAMSRFGYLRTPLPPDATAAAQADAHACLLDALGIARASVMGVSAGGPSAMQFALRHPERCRSLVLLVPVAYAPRAGGAPAVTPPLRSMPRSIRVLLDAALRTDFLFWAMSRIRRRTAVEVLLGTPFDVVARASAAEQARVSTMLERILPISVRRRGLHHDMTVTSTLQRYDLEQIVAPTLAISCADDLYGTYDGARYTAGHVANGRFVGYPSGGHLCVGHQDELAAEIATFLMETASTFA